MSMTREEWEGQFCQRIKSRTGVEDADIFASELESWPVDEDGWKITPPDVAADENLLDWSDDEA